VWIRPFEISDQAPSVAVGRRLALVASPRAEPALPLCANGENEMKFKLSVFTLYGSVEVGEDELPTLTNKELAKLRTSREELRRCLAEGVKLMEGRGDSNRACAYQTYDGKWGVRIVSVLSDPSDERYWLSTA
jgi:hypothetical protein